MVARRLMLAMVAALLFSSIVTFALSRHLAHGKGSSTVRLVAVARDVPAGQPLAPDMLKMVDWPVAPATRGSFTKADALTNRISLIPLAAGDLVLEQQLAPPGAANGLTRKILPGQRAISLKSDEVAGVAGFLLPGSVVDVLVTSTGFNNSASTATVLQDAPVLAAGQKTEPDPDGKPATVTVVTLLVSPVDAEKLALASSSGKIHFVLRNAADRQQVANLAPELSVPSQPMQTSVAASPKPSAPASSTAPAKAVHKVKSDGDTVEVVLGGRSNEAALPAAPMPPVVPGSHP